MGENRTPLVTVSMVTYNHKKYIAQAIDSVLGQSFKDLELVVVDDGSTDGTGDIVKKFNDPRISYIRQENQGPSVAANTALLNAKGRYIALMSGDDVSLPVRVERQLEEYGKEGRARLLFSYNDCIDDEGRIIAGEHPAKDLFVQPKRSRHELLNRFFTQGNCLNGITAFTETRVLIDLGLYNPLLLQTQDFDMWIRAALRYDIHVIPERLIEYRIRANSANLSAPNDRLTVRTAYEYQILLKNYLRIGSVDELFKVFPEAKERFKGVDDGLIPFVISMLALEAGIYEPYRPAYQVFAFNTLFELMSSPDVAGRLKERCGFAYTDLIRLTGEYDFSNSIKVRDLEAKAHEMYLNGQEAWRRVEELNARLGKTEKALADTEKRLHETGQIR